MPSTSYDTAFEVALSSGFILYYILVRTCIYTVVPSSVIYISYRSNVLPALFSGLYHVYCWDPDSTVPHVANNVHERNKFTVNNHTYNHTSQKTQRISPTQTNRLTQWSFWTGRVGSWRQSLSDFKTIGTSRWQACQPYAPAAFTPLEICLVLISVRGWDDPTVSQRKIPKILSGIEPAIFRLLRQGLNRKGFGTP